jgi:acyl dehydratase
MSNVGVEPEEAVLPAKEAKAQRVVTTPGRTIGEGDINLFAGLVGDFTPIHVDDVAAKASPHGARIAHGPLAMATAIGMLTQTGIMGDRVIGLVNLNWDFCGAVKINDTIRSRVTIEESRPTSKPGRELTTFAFEVINQDNVVVQRGKMLVVMRAEEQPA